MIAKYRVHGGVGQVFLHQSGDHFLRFGLVDLILGPNIMVLTIPCPDDHIRLNSLIDLDEGLLKGVNRNITFGETAPPATRSGIVKGRAILFAATERL